MIKKNYQILEHKADLKMRAFGKTKKEVFLNMALAMQDFLLPKIKKEKAERKIEIKSEDLPLLLVDFLNEILYLNFAKKEVYEKIEFEKFSEREILAKVLGQKVKSFQKEIKAATYHQIEIKKNKFWKATVLFDI